MEGKSLAKRDPDLSGEGWKRGIASLPSLSSISQNSQQILEEQRRQSQECQKTTPICHGRQKNTRSDCRIEFEAAQYKGDDRSENPCHEHVNQLR